MSLNHSIDYDSIINIYISVMALVNQGGCSHIKIKCKHTEG